MTRKTVTKAKPMTPRPDPLPKLTDIQRERLCHFVHLRDRDPLGNAPDMRKMATRCGCSIQAMWQTMDQLVEHGCVERGRVGFRRETDIGREAYAALIESGMDVERVQDPPPLNGR